MAGLPHGSDPHPPLPGPAQGTGWTALGPGPAGADRPHPRRRGGPRRPSGEESSGAGQAKAKDPTTEITRLDAATYEPHQLDTLVSPSLFGEPRLVYVPALEQMTDALLSDLIAYVGAADPEVSVILRPTGASGANVCSTPSRPRPIRPSSARPSRAPRTSPPWSWPTCAAPGEASHPRPSVPSSTPWAATCASCAPPSTSSSPTPRAPSASTTCAPTTPDASRPPASPWPTPPRPATPRPPSRPCATPWPPAPTRWPSSRPWP